MRIANERQFWAGVMFVVFGLVTLAQVPQYSLGSVTRMGPGYFPMLVATVLVILGSVGALGAIRTGTQAAVGRWPITPMLFVAAGVLVFAALIERAGLIASVVCLVALSCYRRLRANPLEVAIIAGAVSVLAAAVFVYGVGLPIALW